MFSRAVTFVRASIPESLAEKAQPFVEQAQGYANTYIERAQSMKTKIHDYAVNRDLLSRKPLRPTSTQRSNASTLS
jgi:hypothetical protein